MRIIAGNAKGRKILSPYGSETRPTSDRVKESLFNILGSSILNAKILDLFAGTGNLGLEALSRGAENSVFIDRSYESIKIINQNIKLLKFEKFSEVFNNDAVSAIHILSRRNLKFDIVFLDPPYHKDIIPPILEEISKYNILSENGIILAEHDVRDVLPDETNGLYKFRKSDYGSTTVSFYRSLA